MGKDNDEKLHQLACDLVNEIRSGAPCQITPEEVRFKELLRKFIAVILVEDFEKHGHIDKIIRCMAKEETAKLMTEIIRDVKKEA